MNGSLTKEFHLKQGLRQGDLLSPFLFNIVAEALTKMLEKAIAMNLVQPMDVNGFGLSHLQYADDIILFCKDDGKSIFNLKKLLRGFELLAGLKVNFFKSSLVGINIRKERVHSMVSKLWCKSSFLPMKYLGIPFGANPK